MSITTIIECDGCHAEYPLRGAWSEWDVLMHSGYVRGGNQHLCAACGARPKREALERLRITVSHIPDVREIVDQALAGNPAAMTMCAYILEERGETDGD